MVEQVVNIMGGELYVYVLSKDKDKEFEILAFFLYKIAELVDIFNFFDKSSLLSRLNRERSIPYQEDLAFVLKKSIELKVFSENKFNVFLGQQIKERKLGLDTNYSLIDINFNDFVKITNSTIFLSDPNFIIDLGGIAKGYILDRALELALEKYPGIIEDVLLDARGDIVCFGKHKKNIEVENPFDENISFSEISLDSGSVITSGHNKQKFKNGSHIIGSQTDILTLSLASKTRKCFELDALGTYLMQLSSQEVLEKIEFDDYYKDIDCLLILSDGNVFKSSFWDSIN